MSEPLHVLVYGTFDAGACDVYRFGMHREALHEHGVDLRPMTDLTLRFDPRNGSTVEDALRDERVEFDRAQLDWADVLVFRRFYVTRWSCRECALVSPSRAELQRHRRGTGHEISEPDRLIRPLWSAISEAPEVLRGRAIVYESDDDLLNVKAWNGVSRRIEPERDVIEAMVRRADLVTVTTPVLAERHRAFNDVVRVVRNAVEPSWYEVPAGAQPREDLPGDPRLLYYAKPNRMRDYDVCRGPVDAVVADHPGARRVWLGALNAPAGGSPEPVIRAVDEVGAYVGTPAGFSASLAAARPDIGLAPLVGDEFDQAKSELHWLEYTMAGAATVATRMAGGGPFDVIRDGVDGFLASDRAEWEAALRRLVASPSLRAEVAGAARERVLRESTVAARAPEWADAYRWAAEHAGRSVAGRVHVLGALPSERIEPEAAASLAHRRRARVAASQAPSRLAALRGTRAACWPASDAVDPLVSVLVPVVDEPAGLVTRAVRSALDGTHRRIEVIVAHPADTGASRAKAADPRVRFVAVETPALPGDADADRATWTGTLLAAGLGAATGAWIAPLGPEAVFSADHIATLLEVATEHELELVYGQAVVDVGAVQPLVLGAWPPNPDGVLTTATELYSARLRDVATYDPESWRDAESPGWAHWRALLEAGVRAAGIDHPVAALTILADEADAA